MAESVDQCSIPAGDDDVDDVDVVPVRVVLAVMVHVVVVDPSLSSPMERKHHHHYYCTDDDDDDDDDDVVVVVVDDDVDDSMLLRRVHRVGVDVSVFPILEIAYLVVNLDEGGCRVLAFGTWTLITSSCYRMTIQLYSSSYSWR
jgi:hypothetical protein